MCCRVIRFPPSGVAARFRPEPVARRRRFRSSVFRHDGGFQFNHVMRNNLFPAAVIRVALSVVFSIGLHAQVKFTPEDVGQTVNGFQDDFAGAARNPDWVPVPPELDLYEQTGGLLRVTVVGEALDTHLLYEAAGYNDTVQEVLARIRVTAFGTGDAPRCGIAVAVNPDNSQGINLHFRDHDQDGVLGRQFKLLDDRRAWGPRGLDTDWEDNTWYWLRLRQIGPGTGTTNNTSAKVWLADGRDQEPGGWQMDWRRSGRVGFAGIVGSSIGGLSEFEVDYILIKADGLPSIKVSLSAFPDPRFLSIRQHPANAMADAARQSSSPLKSQAFDAGLSMAKGGCGSTNFMDSQVPRRGYTTPPLTRSETARNSAVVSISGARVTSLEAMLTVDDPADLGPGIGRVDRRSVSVVFEPVTSATATNRANYATAA